MTAIDGQDIIKDYTPGQIVLTAARLFTCIPIFLIVPLVMSYNSGDQLSPISYRLTGMLLL
jgi:hypothetical protein